MQAKRYSCPCSYTLQNEGVLGMWKENLQLSVPWYATPR